MRDLPWCLVRYTLHAMQWLRARLLLVLLAIAGIIVLFASFLATREPQIKTGPASASNWSGEDIFAKPSSAFGAGTSPIDAATQDDSQGFAPAGTDDRVFSYPYPNPFSGASEQIAAQTGADIAEGSPPAQSASAEAEKTADTGINSFFNNAYSLLPRGLISVSIPKPETRTSEEQALYDYGNAVGANIKEFESTHKNNTALKNFFPEQGGYSSGDSSAVNAVILLANDYSQLGKTIASIGSVPEGVQALHLALAKSYVEVGDGLAVIASTKAGGDIIPAILAYDNSAGIFIKNFVALAEFFSARGIKFSAGDPGSVFRFSR